MPSSPVTQDAGGAGRSDRLEQARSAVHADAPVPRTPAQPYPATSAERPVRHRSAVSQADLDALAVQLGRLPRGVVAIAARCVCGRPTVVMTSPRLPDGSPFPTTYYLTHPAAVHGCSTLEAEHLMVELTERLSEDAELAAAYQRAHEAYLADRALLGRVEQIEGVSAGGMPTRVKCLHALVGHALAAGPGVNPVGDITLEVLRERGLWDPAVCSC